MWNTVKIVCFLTAAFVSAVAYADTWQMGFQSEKIGVNGPSDEFFIKTTIDTSTSCGDKRHFAIDAALSADEQKRLITMITLPAILQKEPLIYS